MASMKRYLYTTFVIMLLFGCGHLRAAENVQDRLNELQNSFQRGEITRAQKLISQAEVLFKTDNLAAGVTGTIRPIKSGTPITLEIKEYWNEFSPEEQAALAASVSRPSKAFSYDSPGGSFKIHYDTIGVEPVPTEDLNDNQVPDFVERIADYMDSSLVMIVDHLGYLPLLSDNGAGGDDRYDVYLISIGAYGVTYPGSQGDSSWNDYNSFIGIHNNFSFPLNPNGDPDGTIPGAMKVTCAHELFHAIQLVYNLDYSYLWWMECNSTWMENIVYPIVDDNYGYLYYFFHYPQTRLTYDSGLHMYGAFVWASFLAQNYGNDVIRRAWEYSRWEIPTEKITALNSIDSALKNDNVKVSNIFDDFTIWNYFTGARAKSGYYTDAADYPAANIDQQYTSYVSGVINPINAPDGLACNYLKFQTDASYFGHLKVSLRGNPAVVWGMSVIASDGYNDSLVYIKQQATGDTLNIYIPYANDYESFTVVPTIVSQYQDAVNYDLELDILPYGDANYDGSVNIVDASYIVNYIFFGGEAPKPFLVSGDANCDGSTNIVDASTIVSYIFSGGAAPCQGP